MKRFKVGRKYVYTRFCDEEKTRHEVVIDKVTSCFVRVAGEKSLRKKYAYGGTEYFYVDGQYSFSPAVYATDEV
jgi:hypothetical protein